MTTAASSLDDLRRAKEAKDAVKDAIPKLIGGEQSLRTRCAELLREYDSIRFGLQTRDEIVENALRELSQREDRWFALNASRWAELLSVRYEIRGDGMVANPEREYRVAPRVPDFTSIFGAAGALSFDDVLGLAGPVVKEAIVRLIQSVPADRFGLPAAVRAARLAELEQEIAAAEAEHTELVEFAAEFGIQFQLLDSVVRRREEEALQPQRELLQRKRAAFNES